MPRAAGRRRRARSNSVVSTKHLANSDEDNAGLLQPSANPDDQLRDDLADSRARVESEGMSVRKRRRASKPRTVGSGSSDKNSVNKNSDDGNSADEHRVEGSSDGEHFRRERCNRVDRVGRARTKTGKRSDTEHYNSERGDKDEKARTTTSLGRTLLRLAFWLTLAFFALNLARTAAVAPCEIPGGSRMIARCYEAPLDGQDIFLELEKVQLHFIHILDINVQNVVAPHKLLYAKMAMRAARQIAQYAGLPSNQSILNEMELFDQAVSDTEIWRFLEAVDRTISPVQAHLSYMVHRLKSFQKIRDSSLSMMGRLTAVLLYRHLRLSASVREEYLDYARVIVQAIDTVIGETGFTGVAQSTADHLKQLSRLQSSIRKRVVEDEIALKAHEGSIARWTKSDPTFQHKLTLRKKLKKQMDLLDQLDREREMHLEATEDIANKLGILRQAVVKIRAELLNPRLDLTVRLEAQIDRHEMVAEALWTGRKRATAEQKAITGAIKEQSKRKMEALDAQIAE